MSADVTETGTCVMPAKLFGDIVRKLPDDMVTVYIDDNYRVTIQCGIVSFTISAMDAEDYPDLPDVESNKGITITQHDLRDMIDGTIFAVSENQVRPIHTGCLFEIEDDVLTMVGVDGYRLALRRAPVDAGRPMKFVVPGTALREVEKMLEDTDEKATFTLGTKHITFAANGVTLVCRLLEGEFLDWRRVVPTENPILLTAQRTKLYNAIDRMSLMISEKVKAPVRCTFEENEVDLKTSSPVGSAHDTCPLAGDGKGLEIGFNCKYLMDALRAAPADEITLELSNGLSPIVMTPTDHSGKFAYMILPVRLKGE
jgi:DNA polymerase-3 subunit beta